MAGFPIREPSIMAMRDAPVYFRWGSNKRRTLVDGLTARAIVLVYDAANTDNQIKMERMVAHSPERLARVADLAFRLTSFVSRR